VEVALIGVLATALFSVVGLLGAQMNGLRNDLQRNTERIGEHHAQTRHDFGEVRNAIDELRRDVSVLRGEVGDLRQDVRAHLTGHA